MHYFSSGQMYRDNTICKLLGNNRTENAYMFALSCYSTYANYTCFILIKQSLMIKCVMESQRTIYKIMQVLVKHTVVLIRLAFIFIKINTFQISPNDD